MAGKQAKDWLMAEIDRAPGATCEVELSVVIPCYNEQDNIELVLSTFAKLAHELPRFEILFVNDGSRDKTAETVRSYAQRADQYPFAIRLLNLSRNFGHQLALLAGMKNALGQACVSIDADLQDPPEKIIEMVALWRMGYEVVLGQRVDRTTDTWFKRTTAQGYYRLMTRLTNGKLPEDVADFRLVSRRVLDVLCSLKETAPFWRGLVAWVGYKTAIVTYARQSRQFGETKYPLAKMISFAMDGALAFSREPLRLVTRLGLLISVVAFLFGVMYVVQRMMGVEFVPGWTAIIGVSTFLGGIQLVCLGIIGEYIGRIYEQSLGRPQVLFEQPETIVALAAKEQP